MGGQEVNNQTSLTEFIIIGFPSLGVYRVPLFLLLLLIYLLIITGNMLIFLVIRMNHQLHTPMYFFVSALSFLEIWYTAVTVPKMLANVWVGRTSISFSSCLLQMYFFHSLGITENYILTAMAYDRYVAICNPLRYTSIMTSRFSTQLAGCCWILGFMSPVPKLILVSKLPFCGPNEVKHLFCDLAPLLNLVCADTALNIIVDFAVSSCIIVLTTLFILLTYIKIIVAILKINSSTGRNKAFSTCAAHLIVVCIFFGSVSFMYIRLQKTYSRNYDRAVAVNYSVLTPLFNPLVYSLRNKDMKECIRKYLRPKEAIPANRQIHSSVCQ
ncbi:olfactory receptor 6N2-like [Ambystoma mexicanum]|uniref:olfactory receptor 6N2-like n=1 Tax=Ambystoma mexicanum TaxID=8296 RepID=UPI0037E8E113